MSNVLLSMAHLVESVHTSSYDLISKNIDKIVEKYSSEYKPIKLPNGDVIPHSKSTRYVNGELRPDYVELQVGVIPEDELQVLIENNKQRLSMQKEIRLLINYAKVTVHNAIRIGHMCNIVNPTREIYWLVRQNIPEMILDDKELLKHCFDEHQLKLLFTPYETIKDTLKEYLIKEFKDKTTYPEAIKIFENFYTLRLLTNV